MGKPNFSDDFKRDAVHQVTVRGYPVCEVSERLPDLCGRLLNLCARVQTIMNFCL